MQPERLPGRGALLRVPVGRPQKMGQGQSAVGRRRRGDHGREGRQRRRCRAWGGARPQGGDQPTEGVRLLKLSSRAAGPQGPLLAACWQPPTPPPCPVPPRGGPKARVFPAGEDTMRSVTRGAAPSVPQGLGSQRAQAPPTGQGTNALAFAPDCTVLAHTCSPPPPQEAPQGI